MTKWRGSATAVVELKCSKSKNLTGKCFGNPTSWWPAAGPAQRQWWWRSTPSCSAASDRWPGPVRSTSPAKGQRVHMCSSKSTSNVNNQRRLRSVQSLATVLALVKSWVGPWGTPCRKKPHTIGTGKKDWSYYTSIARLAGAQKI